MLNCGKMAMTALDGNLTSERYSAALPFRDSFDKKQVLGLQGFRELNQTWRVDPPASRDHDALQAASCWRALRSQASITNQSSRPSRLSCWEIWRPVGSEIVAEHSHRLAKTALGVRSLVGQDRHKSPASPLRFGECRSPHVLSTSRFVGAV